MQEQTADNYPSFNVLIFCLSKRSNYRTTIFSTGEVFCSPDCDTKIEDGHFRTIKTPSGLYDIALIINQLPSSQKPELVIVKADATKRNFPVNLHILKCPKLLIVGDTHHLPTPIQTLINYARQEQFDFTLSEHDRHHLHYFKEAGFEKVFWIPGFSVNPHPQPARLTRKYPLTFVGQVGKFHPYRKYILARVKQFGFPLHELRAPQEKAAEIYADSLINLNISLNGDLNLRVFEVLASGGFLLTDKLSKQAGLEILFENGKHLAVFKNESELRYKIAFFLENPEAAVTTARNGYDAFWRNHRPELNIKRILTYIDGQGIEPIYETNVDKRSVYFSSKNLNKLDESLSIYEYLEEIKELGERLSIYEYLQKLHLNNSSLRGLFGSQVNPQIISDAVDLPRLDIHIIWDSKKDSLGSTSLFVQCEIFDQITFTSSWQLYKSTDQWDFIALTWDELQTLGIETLLSRLSFQWLVITNASSNLEEEEQKALDDLLERRGFIKDCDRPFVYHWQRKADWGSLLVSQQKFLEAIKAFERALQDNPCDVKALTELGLLSFKLNDLKQAERLFRQAVSLERRNPLALEQLVRVLVAQDQYKEATVVLKYLLSIQSQDASLWLLLETCYQRTNLEQKALEAYRYSRNLKSHKMLMEPTTSIGLRSTTKKGAKCILVINNLYPPQELGGYGRSICDFAANLHERGHTIQVLTSNAPYLGQITVSEPSIDRDLLLLGTYEGGPKSIEDPTEISRIVRHNQRVIRNVIDKFSPDVCLIGNIDFLGAAIFTPFLEKDIPVIHHLGFTTLRYPLSEMPQSPLYLLAAASNYVKQNVLRVGYPFEEIAVVYPGALVKKFEMCVLPNLDKLRIVYAGLLVGSKGPQTLIEALKILHDRNVDFQCSLAGDSLDEGFVNILKNFVKAQGMEEQVKFFGYLRREELIGLFSINNVLVFPSISEEAFGISQVEGMAAGLTLITTGVGGAGEVIDPDVSGLQFPAEDAAALAEALISLSKDRERWECIAVAGQERAMRLFNIEQSVEILEEKFDELLQRRDSNEEFLHKKLQADLSKNLRLRKINLIIFPDWSQPEESLSSELEQVIRAVITHPDQNYITLLIDSRDITEEEANLAISGAMMSLLMKEELDITEEPEISLIGQLSEMQWSALLRCLQARIVVENESQQAIAQTQADKIPLYEISSLRKKRAVQQETGDWVLQEQ